MVCQGSVLGPILFTLYASSLRDICRKHGACFHGYADDQQIYLSFKPSNSNTLSQDMCIAKLESCVRDIRLWMRTNLLKLNDDKTEFIILGTRQQLSIVGSPSIQIGNDDINCVTSVRNLGFYMDQELKNGVHINKLSSVLYFTIRKIAQIRPLLDRDTTKILMQSLVLSRIDYCNSLLLGSAQYQLDKLQRLQNMACRIICQKRKFDHITSDLIELHWLKPPERITFKVAMLMFCC